MPVEVGRHVRRRWARSSAIPAASIWLVFYAALVVTDREFDTSYLNFGWQLVPWDVLTSDPIRSIWFLHVQPPGWNLFLGVPAWLSPLSDRVTVQLLMLGLGLVVVALAATLARELGLGRRPSIAVALVATLHPEVMKGVFEPNYEIGVAALLLGVALAVVRLESKPDFGPRFIRLSIVLTALVMTRSLYHPVLLVAILVVLGAWGRKRLDRRSLTIALLVPAILVGGWVMKNQVLFGQANLSSWFGMNLQRAVIPVLDRDELESMYEDGDVSDIAMVGPFGDYALYEPFVEPCSPSHSHRSVTEPLRTTDEVSPNFNYECFLPVFEQAGRDAWAVIRQHPDAWLEGRLWSLRTTFAVATSPSESQSVVMRLLDDVYSVMRLDYRGVLTNEGWGTPIYGRLVAPTDFGLVLVGAYVLVVSAGIGVVVRGVRRRRMEQGDWTIVVTSLLAGFTIVVGAVAELGEQSRFRTAVDPLVSVLVVVLVSRFVARLRGRDRGQSQAESVG